MTAPNHRLPVGAEIVPGGVHVRAWAPGHARVDVVTDAGPVPLTREAGPDGYFSAVIPELRAGDRYRLSVDGGRPVPDPASRFQPDGPHGPSAVVDPAAFHWTDENWTGPHFGRGAVYELHIGTFTREGTWDAARERLPDLVDLGVDIVEVMPIADFPGDFGWGYDGVNLFAPTRLYGQPDDLRRFVDAAHAVGLGVILDVVYNHIGPDGNYLGEFAAAYLSRRHTSDWGDTFNFDDADAGPVRELVVANARYWIVEFHFDGLRLDATQQVSDDSQDHILAAIGRAVREAGGARRTVVVAENEPQDADLVRTSADGGYGLDALWNDDLHHSAMVALTGRHEAYYSDHRGTPQEFVSAAKHGFLFQGQRYTWQKDARGAPALDLSPGRFVSFLQNHDQVANSAHGKRADQLTSAGRLRALTAYLLLSPATPMLFMGQEFAASSPFLFFAHHDHDLARKVHAGRRKFLAQFPSLANPAAMASVADPSARSTFERCRLHHTERTAPGHAEWLALHKSLLALRRERPAFRRDQTDRESAATIDGAVLGDAAFLLRFFPDAIRRGRSTDEALLIVNLGPRLALAPVPEPLIAAPSGGRWRLALSTDEERFGGPGASEPETPGGWVLPAEAAVVLVAG